MSLLWLTHDTMWRTADPARHPVLSLQGGRRVSQCLSGTAGAVPAGLPPNLPGHSVRDTFHFTNTVLPTEQGPLLPAPSLEPRPGTGADVWGPQLSPQHPAPGPGGRAPPGPPGDLPSHLDTTSDPTSFPHSDGDTKRFSLCSFCFYL